MFQNDVEAHVLVCVGCHLRIGLEPRSLRASNAEPILWEATAGRTSGGFLSSLLAAFRVNVGSSKHDHGLSPLTYELSLLPVQDMALSFS